MAKVYVSSTIADLAAERRAVMEWLRAARHQAVDSYLPDSDTVRESCLNDIDTCDLYVLILGHRYGFQPEDGNPERLSITHLEFRRAGQSGIPRVALLRTSIPDVRLSDFGDPQKLALVNAFREEVQRAVRPAEFADLQGLIQGLSAGIQNELDKLRAPAERRPADAWLAAQLRNVSQQFAEHMAASILRPGARPADLYLDLAVSERRSGKAADAGPESQGIGKERYTLEDVLQGAQSPLLLLGEGGSGKTTSLLYTAARTAERAAADAAVPVPIYVNLARLTELHDIADLQRLIADSVPMVKDWSELSDSWILARRRILFLFDSFNEMPERLQQNAAVDLLRFVEKQKDHLCLIGSRPVPHVEPLIYPPSPFRTFEILRLSAGQVQGFLQGLGLGSLYDRMPGELRELAGNPFMLLAIARTLAGAPESALPHNQGKLYERFVRGWMDNEEHKRGRSLAYSYPRVKEPLLAYLARRMTAAGQTSLAWSDDIAQEFETQLEATYRRVKRRGGMPKNWQVDPFLDEALGDGLLKRVDAQLHFMHQSLQEYFTALYFRAAQPAALAAFTPKLAWELVHTYELAAVPNHRFVPALLMLAGLLDDGTQIVEALAARNPILAAAAIAAANRVDAALLARLEQAWLALLDHEDRGHRVVGCTCAALAPLAGPRARQRLIAFALDPNNSIIGRKALARLGVPEAIVLELAESVRNLPDDEYAKQERRAGQVVKELQCPGVVKTLFDQWRAAAPDSPARRRFAGLLASVDRALLDAALQSMRSAADPALAADAERVIAEWTSGDNALRIPLASAIRQRWAEAQKKFTDGVTEMVRTMRDLDDQALAAAVQSPDRVERAAAAILAAARQAPIGDAILESVLRFDEGLGREETISALVALWGADTAAARLVERSRERCCCLGSLPPELAAQLTDGELSEPVRAEIERLGVRSDNLEVVEKKLDTWLLSPRSWGSYRPLYEVRSSPGALEFYDCNAMLRALTALGQIPGDAALAGLRGAFEHGDLPVPEVAMRALVERRDQGLADRLLAKLHSGASADFAYAALDALTTLHDRAAVSLLGDLFVITDEDSSEVHPVWGLTEAWPRWRDAIHRVLLTLRADGDVRQALDGALAAEDPLARAAAAGEFSRWFAEADLDAERVAAWRTPARGQRLVALALRDASPSVRTAAGQALADLKSEEAQTSLADALADEGVEVQVAAGEALVRIGAADLYERVTEAMLRVAQAAHSQELRRRAGQVLTSLQHGLEPFYQPIQQALARNQSGQALELIEAALEILPEDVNLHWWRGHALRGLGQLAPAADSFQRASELEQEAAVIPQALAQTFLDLGDVARAVEAARRGVKIDPGNADAWAILARSSYRAGAVPEAAEAAGKAVDLDPVHDWAIWLVLLAHLRLEHVQEARAACEHALRVRQHLWPGLDVSFVSTFMDELANIQAENPEISRLIEEIKDAGLGQQGTPARLS